MKLLVCSHSHLGEIGLLDCPCDLGMTIEHLFCGWEAHERLESPEYTLHRFDRFYAAQVSYLTRYRYCSLKCVYTILGIRIGAFLSPTDHWRASIWVCIALKISFRHPKNPPPLQRENHINATKAKSPLSRSHRV